MADEKEELLLKVKTAAEELLKTKGFVNKEELKSEFDRLMEGLDLVKLKGFNIEQTEKTLKDIGIALEKVKNVNFNFKPAAPEVAVRDFIFKAFSAKEDGTESEFEGFFRAKKKGSEIELKIKAAANMTTANTIDENNFPLEMIESVDLLDQVVLKRRGLEYIGAIADRTVVPSIEQYTSWLEEGSEQGAFAIVTEGSVKPLVSTALVRNNTKAKKVAGKMVVTEEFAKFRPKAWNSIKTLLNSKFARDYQAILTADLNAIAASYVGTSLDGTIAVPTDYDAIAAVAAQIETLNFVPDTLVLNPQDKWRLLTDKDSQNRYYMLMLMSSSNGLTSVMGFRVITSTYQTAGRFTLLESNCFKIEEEALTVRLAYGVDVTTATQTASGAAPTVVTAVKSDADSNQFRMIVETYFKDWIATNDTGSAVNATFTAVKAALLAA